MRVKDTFADVCYDQNTISELEESLIGEADADDCAAWGLTPDQWREQIGEALAAKRQSALTKDLRIFRWFRRRGTELRHARHER